MMSGLGWHAIRGCSKYVLQTLGRPNVTAYCSNCLRSPIVTGRQCHRYHNHTNVRHMCNWNGTTVWCNSSHSTSRVWQPKSRTFIKVAWLSTDKSLSNDEIEYSCDNIKAVAAKNFLVIPNFISSQEEQALLTEIDRHFRGIRYEYDHWDNAIHGFRETEKSKWGPKTQFVLQRVRDHAFSSEATQLPLVHVLDLAENGYIKAHVDSVKFCGPTIAGLSLISPSVLRLVKENDSALWLKAVLPARSLYIMRNQIRFDYTHEILKDEESFIGGERVKRGRRVSVMFRDLPTDNQN